MITIDEHSAVIHERCIGCGKCVTACPEGAISIVFDPQVDFMRALRERINERVEIYSNPPRIKRQTGIRLDVQDNER